jgi:hypothetical protein
VAAPGKLASASGQEKITSEQALFRSNQHLLAPLTLGNRNNRTVWNQGPGFGNMVY